MEKIIIDGNSLTLEDIVSITRKATLISLSTESIERVKKSRAYVESLVDNERVVYGITTGFGKFSNVGISKDESKLLQKNLIITHAVGAGEPFNTDIVRGIMLLRINNLAKGYSGIRLETLETLIDMLNKGVHPIIPQKGSLGASGDLAPLSHMVLPLIGLGEAEYKGVRTNGSEAMKKAGITPIELTSKEGLALINGTQAMTSVGAHTIYDALNLSEVADIIAALSVEAHRGIITAFDHKVHDVRPHAGQVKTASNLLELLDGSKMTTHQGEIRVQDAYSLRCLPQVHGATRDALAYIKNKVEIEINSVTDNPIIFPDSDQAISGGNFHGQPMALSFDFMGIAIAELANISERRLERLVNPALSELPAFLVENGGLNSGFMIVQYSAAALVSENKVLAHPASVDSIPSSANQEDHVSMGTIAAIKGRTIFENARRVLAMELMCACQAIDLRGNRGLGKGTKPAYDLLRSKVTKLTEDRPLYEDINACEKIIIDSSLLNAVNTAMNK